MSASIFRAREAGTRAFMMRFSRPGTILERFLSRPLRPSDTHCSTLIGFIGMVFGSRPNFSSTAVFVNPAASTVTQTPSRLLKIATHASQYDQRGQAMEEQHARSGSGSRRPLQLRLDGEAGAGDASVAPSARVAG